MRCNRVEALLSAFIDEELAAEDRRAVERHLAACRACAERRRQLVAVRERVRAIGGVGVSAGFDAQVMARLDQLVASGVTWGERVATAMEGVFSTRARRLAGAVAAGLLIAFAVVLPSTGVEYKVQSVGAAGTAPGSRLSVSVDRMVATADRIAPVEIRLRTPRAPANGG